MKKKTKRQSKDDKAKTILRHNYVMFLTRLRWLLRNSAPREASCESIQLFVSIHSKTD